MLKKHLAWIIVNTIFVLAFLVLGIWEHNSFSSYVLFGVGIGVLVSALNWAVFRTPPVFTLFYIFGLLTVLAGISHTAVKIIVAAIGVSIFALSQLEQKKALPQYLARISGEIFPLAAGFLLIASIWIINFFFSPPAWMVSLTFAVVVYLLFQQIFRNTLWVVICTLLMVELNMVLGFLPFFWLTLAVISFALYYFLHEVGHWYLAGRLSSKKLYFQTAVTFF